MTFALLAAALGIAFWAIAAYNRLVRLRNQYHTAWADIGVQLQRRHNLVPRLVEVTKGYAAHERATLIAVTELRAQALTAKGASQQGQTEAALEQALGKLLLLRESYPDLKANENFSQLSASLVEVEEHLQYARRFYNGAVRDYNNGIQRFPALIIAIIFAFKQTDFFQAEHDSTTAPDIRISS
ncbi:MAG: LemA family protein [Thermomonas sp.]|uniref:LemA family protein n=1 Tax=Thermomonas sp. TaxID=1971895 RepID=UPI001EB2936D|nr:LemA family protein [Thermomonas sp.]MBV2208868.1 LemA family protein [Thermomonas sp.]